MSFVWVFFFFFFFKREGEEVWLKVCLIYSGRRTVFFV